MRGINGLAGRLRQIAMAVSLLAQSPVLQISWSFMIVAGTLRIAQMVWKLLVAGLFLAEI
jgi:hypothetical protein